MGLIKNYTDNTNILPSDKVIGTAGETEATKNFTLEDIATFVGDSISKYTCYTAIMNQSGTAAPTATIMENSIGAIVWTRDSAGTYVGSLSHVFTENKTWITCVNQNSSKQVYCFWIDASTIGLETEDSTDGNVNASIEIRVYN